MLLLLLSAGCTRDLDIPSGAGYLFGRAVEPVPGTSAVRALSGATVGIPGTNLGAVTDAGGNFVLGPLPTGRYSLLLTSTAAGRSVRRRLLDPQQVLNGATLPVGDVQLEESASLDGRALLQDKASGYSGIIVYLIGLDIPATTTADSGRWTLSGLPEGTLRAAAWRPGYQTANTADLAVQGGALTSAVDLVLVPEVAQPQPGSISGRVVVMGAADASGVSVSIATSTPADLGAPGSPLQTVSTPAGGAFKFDGLPPGLYTVRASATGLPEAHAANLALAAGGSVVLADFILAHGQPQPAELPPVLQAPAQVTGSVGKPLAFTVTASASAGKPAISLQGEIPAGATLTPKTDGSAEFSWVPDAAAAAAGGVDLVFAATAQGLTSTAATRIDVYPLPLVQVFGPTHLSGGQSFDLAVTASSRYPGATWTLSATGTPVGAEFKDQSASAGTGAATFHWGTALSDHGSFPVAFMASDGLSQAQLVVTLVVDKVSVAPVLAGPLLPQLVTVGATSTVALSATDATLDPITFSVSPPDHPGAKLVDAGNGTATFTYGPPAADAGSVQYFTFTASAGGLTAQETQRITVAPLGNRPTLDAPVRLAATAGVQLAFTVTATVLDGVPSLALQAPQPKGARFTDNLDGSGSFTWTPDAAAAAVGSADLVFVATASGASTTATTQVDVYPALNQPPALQVTGALAVDELQTLTLTLTATDPQGSPLQLFVSGNPPNSSLADHGLGSGTFTFSPRIGQAGVYAVGFIASNGKSVTTVPVALTVRAVSTYVPPTLQVVGNTHISGGQAIDLVVAAIDLDATKTLLLSASGTPPGSTFTDLTHGSGSFHWTTGLPTYGTSTVTFSVSDGVTVVSQQVALQVDKFNVSPVLAGPLVDRVVSVGGTLTVQLSAADANLDPLTYSLTPAAHAGAALADHGDGTATFTFSPLAADASTVQQFTFFVSDGSLGAQQVLKVTVPAPGNQPPVWDPAPTGLAVAEGASLTVNLRATDPNSDPITLGPTQLPPYCSFKDNGDGTAVLVVSPGYGAVAATGPVSIGLLASDNHGGATALALSVTISYLPRPPVITHHADVVLGETASVPVAIAATEPDGKALTFAFTITPSGLGVSQGSGASANTLTASAPAGTAGSYSIGVKVSNAFLSASDTVNLTVAPRPTLSVATSGNGTITSSPAGISCASNAGACSSLFTYGAAVTLTESPGSGAQFGGWSGACGGLATTCPLALTTSTSAGAAFGTYYTLGVTVTGPGTVGADSGAISACTAAGGVCSGSYPANLNVLLTATPAQGSALAGWGGSCAGVAGNICTLAMSQARTASASFAPVTTLAVAQGDQQSAPSAAALPLSVIVNVTSSTGAVVSGAAVALAGPPGSVVTPPSTSSDAGGKAVFAVRLARTLGAQTFTATAPTAQLPVSLTATSTQPAAGLISTLVGIEHVAGASGVPGPGAAARINSPTGLAVSALDGTTFIGGYNNNQVYALSPAGQLTVVAGTGACGHAGDLGPATAAQLCNPLDLALDETHGRRTLFVIDGSLIRAVDLTASPPVISTFAGGGNAAGPGYGDGGPASAAVLSGPQHIALDPAGTWLYVVDTGNVRFRRVDLASRVISAWFSTPANTVCVNRLGLAYCGAGNFYYDCAIGIDFQGAAYVTYAAGGGTACTQVPTVVYRIDAGGVATPVAGGGSNGGEGAPALSASLSGLTSRIFFDVAGNLYFDERDHHRIRRVAGGAGWVTTIVGTGTGGFAGELVDARQAQLNWPWTAVFDLDQDLIVADTNNSTVRTVWSEGAPAAAATLQITSADPQSVVIDQVSAPLKVLLSDSGGLPMAGYPITWSAVDPGGALLASTSLTDLSGVAVTSARAGLLPGMPYRLSASVNAVGRPNLANGATFTVNSTAPAGGSVFTIANVDHSSGGDGYPGPATRAHLNAPTGLAAAADGTLYVAGYGNNQILALSPAGFLSLVAGTGACGHAGDGGAATAAQICSPLDLALDETHGRKTLYLLDAPLVRAIDLTATPPVISTFAGGGTATAPGYGDGGPAIYAALNSPNHLSVDPGGTYLYIADNGINRIRRVDLSTGFISTWFTIPSPNICYTGCYCCTAHDCNVGFDRQGASYVIYEGSQGGSCGVPGGAAGVVSLYRVAANGTTTLIAGNGSAAGEGIPAIGAALSPTISNLFFDAAGAVYLTERSTSRVRKISGLTGGTISTTLGTGAAGNGLDFLAPNATALSSPWAVTVLPDGKLVVTDTGNHALRAIWPPLP